MSLTSQRKLDMTGPGGQGLSTAESSTSSASRDTWSGAVTPEEMSVKEAAGVATAVSSNAFGHRCSRRVPRPPRGSRASRLPLPLASPTPSPMPSSSSPVGPDGGTALPRGALRKRLGLRVAAVAVARGAPRRAAPGAPTAFARDAPGVFGRATDPGDHSASGAPAKARPFLANKSSSLWLLPRCPRWCSATTRKPETTAQPGATAQPKVSSEPPGWTRVQGPRTPERRAV